MVKELDGKHYLGDGENGNSGAVVSFTRYGVFLYQGFPDPDRPGVLVEDRYKTGVVMHAGQLLALRALTRIERATRRSLDRDRSAARGLLAALRPDHRPQDRRGSLLDLVAHGGLGLGGQLVDWLTGPGSRGVAGRERALTFDELSVRPKGAGRT